MIVGIHIKLQPGKSVRFHAKEEIREILNLNHNLNKKTLVQIFYRMYTIDLKLVIFILIVTGNS